MSEGRIERLSRLTMEGGFLRSLLICLSLLVSLSLLRAADALPQPDAADWRYLTESALSMRENVSRKVVGFRGELARVEKELQGQPKNHGELLSIQEYNQAQLDAESKNLTALQALVQALQGMTEATRTREAYLQYRRQVKEWHIKLQNPRGYDGIRQSAEDIASVLESINTRIEQIKETPPDGFSAGPRPQGVALDWQSFPRVDGSTTAQPLWTLVFCRTLGLGAVWTYRWINAGERQVSPERILLPVCGASPLVHDAEYDANTFPGLRMQLLMSGTGNAYRNLICRSTDIIIVARPPSAYERKQAELHGIELESRVIGLDAFIFMVGGANPISNLTIPQLQAIYQDNVLRWSEVGGSNEKLVAYQRERNSGSQETMQELVMKGLTMAPPVEQIIGQGMGGPYNKLNHSSNGIGYTFYYYHTVQSPMNKVIVAVREGNPNAKPIPALKVISINYVLPTPETIRNRTYPYVTEVYAVTRKGTAAENPAIRVRDWLLTPEGQALVAESGYVAVAGK